MHSDDRVAGGKESVDDRTARGLDDVGKSASSSLWGPV
jgi:hypothetical protein